jgi:hypothetical protein
MRTSLARQHLAHEQLPVTAVSREVALVKASGAKMRQSIARIANRDEWTNLAFHDARQHPLLHGKNCLRLEGS